MIKLLQLIPKHIREEADKMPPVRFINAPRNHAYAKPAGDYAGKQYHQPEKAFNDADMDRSLKVNIYSDDEEEDTTKNERNRIHNT